jgi:hypothetical protein
MLFPVGYDELRPLLKGIELFMTLRDFAAH